MYLFQYVSKNNALISIVASKFFEGFKILLLAILSDLGDRYNAVFLKSQSAESMHERTGQTYNYRITGHFCWGHISAFLWFLYGIAEIYPEEYDTPHKFIPQNSIPYNQSKY